MDQVVVVHGIPLLLHIAAWGLWPDKQAWAIPKCYHAVSEDDMQNSSPGSQGQKETAQKWTKEQIRGKLSRKQVCKLTLLESSLSSAGCYVSFLSVF